MPTFIYKLYEPLDERKTKRKKMQKLFFLFVSRFFRKVVVGCWLLSVVVVLVVRSNLKKKFFIFVFGVKNFSVPVNKKKFCIFIGGK